MKRLDKLIEYLFYLFVFLLPWQTRWIWHEAKLNEGIWEYGRMSLYGADIIFGIILILWIIWKIKSTEPKHQNQKLLISFLAIAFLSIVWAQDRNLALYASIKLLEGILLFWIVTTIRFSFTKLGLALVSSALIQAGLGIWQFLTQSTFANKWLGLAFQDPSQWGTSVIQTPTSRFLRAYGSFHPNLLGAFLALSCLICLALYLNTRNRSQKLFSLFSFCVINLALFFTFSRGAGLAYFLSFLFLLIYTHFKKEILCFFSITILIILIFSLIFLDLVWARIDPGNEGVTRGLVKRNLYIQDAKQLIFSRGILGVGIGNFTLSVHNLIDKARASWDYQPVHNVFLLIFTELGIIGLLIFLFLWFNLFKSILKRNFKKNWFSIVSACVILIFIASFFDHFFWSLHFGLLVFWLILGLFKSLCQNL